jgi:hypothetical protein
MRKSIAGVSLVVAGFTAGLAPGSALAHHEAIFGPQSSLVLSAPAFASLQSFSRRLGSGDARTQESTLLLSAGVTPSSRVPVSFTAIVPASSIDSLGGGGARRGLEDIILGARYRLDLSALQDRFGKEGNFILGMAAVEIPTGSIDHASMRGPLDVMGSLLGSVERGAFSGIAYGFYRRHGTTADGLRAGDNLFVGGGAAWTPFDDPKTERLLSLQLGASYETYFQSRQNGTALPGTGGSGLYSHLTTVWGPGGQTLLFATLSLPVVQDYPNPAEANNWRAGAGLVYLFR